MNYDPCERCGSRFPKEFCSQFCSIFKMAKSKEIQTNFAKADYDAITKNLHDKHRHKRW